MKVLALEACVDCAARCARRRVGFLDRRVPGDALDAEARAEVESLAKLPPGAYEGSIASVRGATLAAMRESL